MPRQWTGRKLKVNHASYSPQQIVAIATACTTSSVGRDGALYRSRFRGCYAVLSRLRSDSKPARNTFGFTEKAAFWQLLCSQTTRQRTTWVVGHNVLASLTLLGFQYEIDSGRLSISKPRAARTAKPDTQSTSRSGGLVVLDSPPTILGLQAACTGGRIIAVDLQNWHRATLQAIGRTVGIAALPEPELGEPDIDWSLRTRINALIVHDAFIDLVRFVKENDLGVFRYSAAGQAMSAYRHKHMKVPIYVHDNDAVRSLERSSYFGGRTEVFKRGSLFGTVYQLDVNSLFPFIMQEGLFPDKLEEYGCGPGRGSDLLSATPESMVAGVLLKSQHPIYPMRRNGPVIFPTGIYQTVLCGEELRAAVDNKDILSIGRWALYHRSPLFSSYVADLFATKTQLRNIGRSVWSDCVKLLLNSLYGKFAQLSPQWVDCPGVEPIAAWSRWIYPGKDPHAPDQYRSVGWDTQVMAKERENPNSFPAIAAFVTSAARVYMNTLRAVAGPKNVFYQGCDSLIVNTNGRDNLDACGYLDPEKIGKLKVEMVADRADIFGCQDYTIGAKTVIAGRRPDGSYIDVSRMRQLKDLTMQQLFAGIAIDHIDTVNLPWTRKDSYPKGIVQPDGWVSSIELTGDVSSTDVSMSRFA